MTQKLAPHVTFGQLSAGQHFIGVDVAPATPENAAFVFVKLKPWQENTMLAANLSTGAVMVWLESESVIPIT